MASTWILFVCVGGFTGEGWGTGVCISGGVTIAASACWQTAADVPLLALVHNGVLLAVVLEDVYGDLLRANSSIRGVREADGQENRQTGR